VSGKKYNGVMPAVQLTDESIANVLTYVLNSWGNNGGEITPGQVASKRGH
jgi:nitrite reductase (NO-forming)